MNSDGTPASGTAVLRVLQVEDVATDATLALHELQRAGLSCVGRRVDTETDFRRELANFHPDIVLSDFSMPQFNGMEALRIAAAEYPRLPFIFLSGTIGEENAIRALKNGATDYVLKSNLIRLPATLTRAIAEAAERRARQEAEGQLVKSDEQIKRLNEQLHHLTHYDSLTGLPNSALFHDQLAALIREAACDGSRIAVVSINFNRFRHLNDTLGRKTGDALLRVVAERLGELSLERACLARINADSFAVAIVTTDSVLSTIVQDQLLGVLSEPYQLPGRQIRMTANGGIALFPEDGTDAETPVRNAEVALKQARVAHERCVFYAHEINAHLAEKLALESKLREAVERKEFVLHYQPKLDIKTGQICGLEALIRWNDPDTGQLVAPLNFIPLLEETGLIAQVGAWALGQAAHDYKKLNEDGIACPRIAVNVSPSQLRQKNFARTVFSAIGLTADGISGIDLEITETVIMENIESNIPQLLAMREMGMNVAIDDFGTGYSSLAYLAKLPVTTLKIDRSFVLAMKDSTEDHAIISTIISLAHSVGLRVVAEGVEMQEQFDELRDLDCDEMQGFYLSAPVPVADVKAMLGKSPSVESNLH